MKLFNVQMQARGVKMTVLKPKRSCRISVWQLIEYFTSYSSIPKLFSRWRTCARFTFANENAGASWQSVLPSVMGFTTEPGFHLTHLQRVALLSGLWGVCTPPYNLECFHFAGSKTSLNVTKPDAKTLRKQECDA